MPKLVFITGEFYYLVRHIYLSKSVIFTQLVFIHCLYFLVLPRVFQGASSCFRTSLSIDLLILIVMSSLFGRRGALSNQSRSEKAQATVYQKHMALLNRKMMYKA